MSFALNAYNSFQAAYEGESDRSVVILGSSFLEQTLERYLRKRMVDDKECGKLFDGYAPLATFAAKIEIAYAVGTLPVHVRDDLRVVKKVRNVFAHDPEPLSFVTPRVADLISNLRPIKQSDGVEWRIDTTRGKFLNGIFFILLHLETESERMECLQAPKHRFEVVVDGDQCQA